MSRSYRKTPIIKDHNRGAKRVANKKVRRSQEVPNGKQYRKFYQTWDVVDHVSYCTLMETIVDCYDGQHFWWWKESDLQDDVDRWFKTFFWK